MAGYIKIGDIEGESTDKNHAGWINVLTVSQSLSRPMQSGISGSTRQRASVTCGDVIITKEMDASTPKLIQACCDGVNFPKVEIDVCTSTGAGARVPYYKWVLENVLISSYDVSGQGDDGGQFYETVSMNYEKIAWTYDKMGKDGKSKGKIDASWQVEEGNA
jgi:type VI secretion system secreted protein Hcp